MKKTLLYILTLLIFAVSFSVVAASDENVGAELIFVADFEDGTLNPSSKADWVNTAITSSDLTLDVVQDPTDENNSVLKVRRDGQFGFINLPFDEIRTHIIICRFLMLFPKKALGSTSQEPQRTKLSPLKIA